MSEALILILVAGASLAEISRPQADVIFAGLNANFTEEPQRKSTDKLIRHTGEEPFTGDCDDFATAAYHQIEKAGARANLVIVIPYKRGAHHVLSCGGGWCFDNYQSRVYPDSELELRKRYRKIKIRGRMP